MHDWFDVGFRPMHFNTMEHSPLMPFPSVAPNSIHLSPSASHPDLHTDFTAASLNTSSITDEARVREENWRERMNFLQQNEEHDNTTTSVPHLDVRSPTRSTTSTISNPESLVAQYNREYCSIGKGMLGIYNVNF